MTSMENMPPLLAQIVSDVRIKHISKRQMIFYAGDQSSDVYIVKSGIVKVFDIDDDGNEKILHLVNKPGVIPFAFFSGLTVPTRWYYSAVTDCELYVLPRLKLLGEIRANGSLGIYLMNWLSTENHEILARLSSLGKSSAREKILAALRYLAKLHGIEKRGGWYRISFPVNHQLLADMVGITRESAASVMKGLQDERVVRNPHVTTLEINTKAL